MAPLEATIAQGKRERGELGDEEGKDKAETDRFWLRTREGRREEGRDRDVWGLVAQA
jgi:hypothetical protein